MTIEFNGKDFWTAEHATRRSEFDLLTQVPSNFAVKCAKLLNPHPTILELGCGRGRDTAFFVRNLQATVFAIDIAQNALAFMSDDYPQEMAGIHRINASNTHLPIAFRRNQFDAIYARSAIYTDDNSLQALLKQFRRSLKPDGFVMLEGKTAKSEDIERSIPIGEHLAADESNHIRRVWEIYNSLELIVKAKLTLIDYGFSKETWQNEEKTFLYVICQIFKLGEPRSSLDHS